MPSPGYEKWPVSSSGSWLQLRRRLLSARLCRGKWYFHPASGRQQSFCDMRLGVVPWYLGPPGEHLHVSKQYGQGLGWFKKYVLKKPWEILGNKLNTKPPLKKIIGLSYSHASNRPPQSISQAWRLTGSWRRGLHGNHAFIRWSHGCANAQFGGQQLERTEPYATGKLRVAPVQTIIDAENDLQTNFPAKKGGRCAPPKLLLWLAVTRLNHGKRWGRLLPLHKLLSVTPFVSLCSRCLVSQCLKKENVWPKWPETSYLKPHSQNGFAGSAFKTASKPWKFEKLKSHFYQNIIYRYIWSYLF